MKTIVCYGDSNTWGYIPGSGLRYARELRWPFILQRRLGADVLLTNKATWHWGMLWPKNCN